MNKKNSLEIVLESYPIRFVETVIDGDEIWFSAYNFNGFFKGSLSKGILEYMGKFPEKDVNGYGLHNFVTKYQGKLFWGSTSSEYIAEYDILKEQFTYYKVPDLDQAAWPHDGHVGQFEKYLVIWNTKNFDVVRFDMEKKEFEKAKACKDSILAFENLNKKEGAKTRRGYGIKDGSIYIVASIEKNVILQVDVKKNEKKLHFLDEKAEVHAICSDGNKLWITNASGQLMEWEPISGKLKKYTIGKDVPIENAYFAVCFNDCLYFSLFEIDEILIYHLKSKKIERIKMCTEGTKYNDIDGFPLGTIMIKLIGNEIWLFNSTYGTLQCIRENNIRKQKLDLIGNVGQFLWDRNKDIKQNYLCEDEKCGVQDFTQCLYEEQNVRIDGANNEIISRIGKSDKQEFKSIGSKIYRAIQR